MERALVDLVYMDAIEQAINFYPSDETVFSRAKCIFIEITSSEHISVKIMDDAVCLITEKTHPEANISFDVVTEEEILADVQVQIIASEFDTHNQ